jgi:Dual specificity phosphatase, catalytic domain
VAACFQVGERLFGGCYPGEIPAGVDFILDLTEEDELPPYEPEASEHRRMPIRDFGVPTADEMLRILDTIDEALADGRTVFVHCRGEVGRTGTVIGCYLRRHGASPEEAFEQLDGRPETDEQRALIRGWSQRGKTVLRSRSGAKEPSRGEDLVLSRHRPYAQVNFRRAEIFGPN